MSFRLCAFRLAVVASVTLPAVIATTARAAECQDLTWSKERLSKLDAAIASGQDAVKEQGPASQIRIAEIDAAIASLEQDVATRKGDAAAKGEALLKDIRSARDAYRAESRQQGTRVMSAAAADAGQPSAVSTSTLWSKVDAYLDAVNADLPARQAATQARFAGD